MGFDTICPSSTTDSSHNSPSPAIRFCSLCAKPFTNGKNPFRISPSTWYDVDAELSRDRHTRYCRSRTCKRPRSCRACNAAKTKCSFEAPCARCTKKGIGCVYQEPIIDKGRSAGEYSPPSHGIRTEIRSTPNSLPEGGLRVNDGTLSVGSHAFSHLSAETATALLGDNPVPLVDLSPDMSTFNDSLAIDEFLSLDDNSWAQPECFVDVPMVPYDKTKKQAASWCQWTNRGLSFAVATETDSTLQAVDQRGRPRADHSANLVIQSLRAFPTMMIRRETMPWFIHPRSDLLSNSKKAALPEALSTCMGIAQMFASKTPETKPFLWRTIKVEYSRLLEEVRMTAGILLMLITIKMRQMSKFEVLAATQVCMIYLIMCIVDYSPEDEVNGQELLVALYVRPLRPSWGCSR